MAGMDWFRWHHGSVNDPKFQLIAKRSGASVAEVLAVWACLLEAASMADPRGVAGSPDFEALECALGLSDGQAERIVAAMRARELIGPGMEVTSWEKRQPRRERIDDGATDRKRKQRELASLGVTAGVTPRHAMSRQEEPRGEQSREEKNTSAGALVSRAAVEEACRAMQGTGLKGVDASNAKLLAVLEAGVTVAELVSAAIYAVGKNKGMAYAIARAKGQRQDAQTDGELDPPMVDPDSRRAVEAEGVAKGIGMWDELCEHWPAYKARVRASSSTQGARST